MIQMKFMIQLFMPKIAKLLGLTFMDVDAGTFFLDLVKKSVEEREKSGARYNDFIDQCLDVFKGRSKQASSETHSKSVYLQFNKIFSFYRSGPC